MGLTAHTMTPSSPILVIPCKRVVYVVYVTHFRYRISMCGRIEPSYVYLQQTATISEMKITQVIRIFMLFDVLTYIHTYLQGNNFTIRSFGTMEGIIYHQPECFGPNVVRYIKKGFPSDTFGDGQIDMVYTKWHRNRLLGLRQTPEYLYLLKSVFL